MKTRGTNPGTMSDADLRGHIRSAALEVYEAALLPSGCFEINFAAGTLQRLTHELRLRCAEATPASEDDDRITA